MDGPFLPPPPRPFAMQPSLTSGATAAAMTTVTITMVTISDEGRAHDRFVGADRRSRLRKPRRCMGSLSTRSCAIPALPYGYAMGSYARWLFGIAAAFNFVVAGGLLFLRPLRGLVVAPSASSK